MRQFGLIGFPLSHSFSQGYFSEKFQRENIADASYKNFPIDSIDKFPKLIEDLEGLVGLNVTIPYKEQVIHYLDELDKVASVVEAVNTIKVTVSETGKKVLAGYNTDVLGFEETIVPHLENYHRKALILGTGGASKAVEYVLKHHGLHCDYVSRKQSDNIFKTYDTLTEEDIADYRVIVNCTPLGMFPNVSECPPIAYQAIGDKHILYDLIYNPAETLFLANGKKNGAKTINGLEMLHIQAEKAWEIWNR